MISATWPPNKNCPLESSSEGEEGGGESGVKAIVPYGWKREIVKGEVVYVTPSNCLLWSENDVQIYLLSDGTCKCGIECPLILKKVFNFDPTVASVMRNVHIDNNGTTLSTCNHQLLNPNHSHLSQPLSPQMISSQFRSNASISNQNHHSSTNTSSICPMVHLISPTVHFTASSQPAAVAVLHSTESPSENNATTFLIPQQIQQPVMLDPSLNVHIHQHLGMMSHTIQAVNDPLAGCSNVEIANYGDNF